MLHSITDSTVKQYAPGLAKWSKFCEDYGLDLFNPKIDDFQNFIIEIFLDGASYGTLNTIRCAVSLVSPNKIGDNPLITRLMKAFYKLRPPTPKYQATWDVAEVLEYLKTLEPLENLSLTDLTEKTIMLLALSTAHRVQTFAKIELDNIRETPDGLEILITQSIKTSGPGRPQPILMLPEFKKKRLCVARVVRKYIKVTRKIRGKCQSLFVATKKPHKAVGAQTISRWIKNTMEKSGIDTKIFSAHSTRHAATSAAFSRGTDINVIKEAAGWTKKSRTFYNFYNRQIVDKKNYIFARSVIH